MGPGGAMLGTRGCNARDPGVQRAGPGGAIPKSCGCSAQEPGCNAAAPPPPPGRLTPAVEAPAPHVHGGSAPRGELCARRSAVRICT